MNFRCVCVVVCVCLGLLESMFFIILWCWIDSGLNVCGEVQSFLWFWEMLVCSSLNRLCMICSSIRLCEVLVMVRWKVVLVCVLSVGLFLLCVFIMVLNVWWIFVWFVLVVCRVVCYVVVFFSVWWIFSMLKWYFGLFWNSGRQGISGLLMVCCVCVVGLVMKVLLFMCVVSSFWLDSCVIVLCSVVCDIFSCIDSGCLVGNWLLGCRFLVWIRLCNCVVILLERCLFFMLLLLFVWWVMGLMLGVGVVCMGLGNYLGQLVCLQCGDDVYYYGEDQVVFDCEVEQI